MFENPPDLNVYDLTGDRVENNEIKALLYGIGHQMERIADGIEEVNEKLDDEVNVANTSSDDTSDSSDPSDDTSTSTSSSSRNRGNWRTQEERENNEEDEDNNEKGNWDSE